MPTIPRGLFLCFVSWILLHTPCGLAQQRQQKAAVSKPAAVSSEQRDQEDEKILRNVSNAAAQADSWTDAWRSGLLNEMQDTPDIRKAIALSDQIDSNRKSESHWEASIWTIPNSELLRGEFISQHLGTFLMVDGTGSTMRQRYPNCKTKPEECGSASDAAAISYVVQAPLDVKARILLERLRRAISSYSEIQQFRGKPTDDVFITSWNSAWFDARKVYCSRSPGNKYRDLLGEEQACK